MSILVDKTTRLIVQGITGNEGTFHTRAMLDYGTNVVGGVTPGRGGQTAVDGRVPVFNTVREAVEATGANCSWICSSRHHERDRPDPGGGRRRRPLIVCSAEGIPANDMVAAVCICSRARRCD